MLRVSFLFVAILAIGSVLTLSPDHLHIKNELQMFEEFMVQYKKQYDTKTEFETRFKNFKANLKRIAEANSDPNDHAVYGITKFSDMTLEELSSSLETATVSLHQKHDINVMPVLAHSINLKDVPDTFDWRDHGVVTPVKDQQYCNAYGVFSAIGNIEGQNAIKTGNLVVFSEQQSISCDPQFNSCKDKGWPIWTMQSIIGAGGLETEDDYPYEDREGFCKYNSTKAAVQIQSIDSLSPLDEEAMKAYLYQNGPLSACLNAFSFIQYQSGVINPTTCNQKLIDHCIVIIGYGIDEIPYWLFKNSWGDIWGEQGYGRLARGFNTCGIAQNVTNAILV